jgi:hypothetical protein
MNNKRHVIITIAPPFVELRFERLGRTFPFVLTDLKRHCPDLRWDRTAQVWRGSTAHFVRLLRFCSLHFTDAQIIVHWGKSSTDHDYRQLQLF